jgi:hypothetical protein
LLDSNRAYAAVLSGYSVALIAVQQFDSPDHVFESGMARGAAIAVGIAAIAVVNDLLAAPDSHPQLAARLTALHRRVRDYAAALIRDVATDLTTAALLGDIAALRPEITSLATESTSGSARGAAARSTAIALVTEVHAARALGVVVATADPASRDAVAAALVAATLKFLILNGATEFPLLALALAPFIIGATIVGGLADQSMLYEIEGDLDARRIRNKRSRQPACIHAEGRVPGMVDPRRPREPVLAHDLGIKVERGTGVAPCLERDSWPIRPHGAPPIPVSRTR